MLLANHFAKTLWAQSFGQRSQWLAMGGLLFSAVRRRCR
jgi:hypothetical protein